MELTKPQARCLHHLTAAFVPEGSSVDVIKVFGYPGHANWLRIEVAPFFFLVDEDGVPRNVSTREPQHFT